MPSRYVHIYECVKGCGYTYESPLKVGYVQCPNQIHYPRLASKSVAAVWTKTIDRKA